jgi:hypothetical protein
MLAMVLAAAVSVAVAADASAATRTQVGKKCDAAWTGKHGTKAYRAYKKGCVKAATAAVKAAHDAGNNDDATANRSRAVAACRTQFPAPRNTRAKRKAFKACVAATVSAEKTYGGRPLAATLAGDATTDADGAGTATFTLNQGRGQLCFDVRWTGLGMVSGLHIHAVADDSIVVALDTDANLADGNAKGCVNGISKTLIKAIRQHPDRYYVNVHTDEFAAGAIRGTLHK